MKLIAPILACAAALTLSAKAPKDPVLMTVDGQPVTISEFEYLFHKNADQQLEQESKDDYLQRFIDYKLKVAQARHEQVDTTPEFIKDFKQYRRELTLPYLRDTEVEQQILNESYAHTLENVNIDHIMFPIGRPDLADSVRALIVEGKIDFLEAATKYSIDPSLRQNGGKYGWITAGVYPYEFEEAVYNTPVGEVSAVTETPYGYHIMRINERRPDAGEVHGAHILIQAGEKRDSIAAKALIDSLYGALRAGADFAELARNFSDCPSKAEGGDLGWFGRGRMVPDFEDVIFGLNLNEYSEPFQTRFGWHIAKKIDARRASKNDAMGEIKAAIARDIRSVRPRLARGEQLMKEYNTRLNEPAFEALIKNAETFGYDSTRVLMAEDKTPLIYVADSIITVSDFFDGDYRFNPRQPIDRQLRDRMKTRLVSTTLVYEDHRLEDKYPDFRNVAREYREGLMLFASMEKNVWNRPTDDPEGLQKYFEANRDKYAFTSPRWKGYIIYAASDSLLNQINGFLEQEQPDAAALGDLLKARFPRNVRIERVVLPQGENQIVDYVAFGGQTPKLSGRWANYTTYLGHIINAPEEVADVRGKVSNDWVAELEDEWVKTLRERYPVKVDKKVFKKVK